jgi:hypothetical protein
VARKLPASAALAKTIIIRRLMTFSFGMDGAVRHGAFVRRWRARGKQMPTSRWTENGKTYWLPQLN